MLGVLQYGYEIPAHKCGSIRLDGADVIGVRRTFVLCMQLDLHGRPSALTLLYPSSRMLVFSNVLLPKVLSLVLRGWHVRTAH